MSQTRKYNSSTLAASFKILLKRACTPARDIWSKIKDINAPKGNKGISEKGKSLLYIEAVI